MFGRQTASTIRQCSVDIEFLDLSSTLSNRGEFLRSPAVDLMGVSWMLCLAYCNTQPEEEEEAEVSKDGDEGYLGCFLQCLSDERISVFYSFALINQKHGKPDDHVQSGELQHLFNEGDTSYQTSYETYGVPHFILRSMLHKRASEFLANDKIVIRMNLSATSSDAAGLQETNNQNPWAVLQNAEETFDFEIHVPYSEDGQSESFSVIRTHKLVLSAFSEVFKTMLYEQMSEATNNKFVIDDFLPQPVKTMVNFFYTGEVDTDDYHEVLDALSISCKYQIKGLTTQCEDYLLHNLSEDNVIEIVSIADTLSLGDLKETAMNFIAAHPCCVKEGSHDLHFCTKELLIEIMLRIAPERKIKGRKRGFDLI